jgi:hypothetical protein
MIKGKTTIKEAIVKAWKEEDPEAAAMVSDTLRFKQHYTYNEMIELVAKTLDEPFQDVLIKWDQILLKADALGL